MIHRDWKYLVSTGQVVHIDGYCDKKASNKHNAILGLNRAISVASELAEILNGLGHSSKELIKMINPRSAGEYRPFYKEDSLNRRVDIYYAVPKTMPPTSSNELPNVTKGGIK